MSLDITQHNPEFATAGQITPEEIAQIVALGFKSIIDNRPDFEGGLDQPQHDVIEAMAISQGLTFAYLPVISGAITRDQVEEMARILEELPKPILAFCRSGARSTNMYHMAKQLSE